jgi:pimeloyl-ACP methyl ester carboxylesterase
VARGGGTKPVFHFLAGALAGASAAILYESLVARRGLDPRLVRGSREDPDLPATVLVPGILGSELIRPDGAEAWLNAGNALGHHDLRLPLRLPLAESRDELRPGGLIGVDSVLPRIFGFTEYADLLDFLQAAGFSRDQRKGDYRGAIHHVFTYDWRRCIADSARQLGEYLDELAKRRGDPEARFNLIGHSMGGLVARYYLRYGDAEPACGLPVTWAGARRIANLILVATPSGGSIPALDALLHGDRVGFSSTTLASDVIGRMPAIYELLPPPEARPLVVPGEGPQAADLLDPALWERHGWGPYAPAARARGSDGSRAEEKAFLAAVLERARLVRDALAAAPQTPCPVRVLLLGGDCLPTLARAIVPAGRGQVRFQPASPEEADLMLEDGDGRVTRASVLAAHLPQAETSEHGCGIAEVRHAFFGAADHHGIYREPTFQSLLLRVLLRPHRRSLP